MVPSVLTACAAGNGRTAEVTEPALGSIASVSSETQVARPIDAYLPSSAEAIQVAQVQQNAINRCLTIRGVTGKFDFAANPSELAAFINSGFRDRVVRANVWGFFDTTNATQYGYQAPPGDPGALFSRGPLGAESVSQDCETDSAKEAPGGVTWSDFMHPSILPERGPKNPLNDNRYTAAVTKWSTCMKERGFDYLDPLAAVGDEEWYRSETVDSKQIATATADIECKISTNLVGIGLAVQIAHDKHYIDTHQAALTQFRNDLNNYLRGPVTQN